MVLRGICVVPSPLRVEVVEEEEEALVLGLDAAAEDGCRCSDEAEAAAAALVDFRVLAGIVKEDCIGEERW